MVRIRMTRLGKNKNPFYRIIAIDARERRDGRYIELIGTYEPFKGVVKIDEDLALKFLNEGAKPTDTVRSFLKDKGIWKKFIDGKLAIKKANVANKKPSKKSKTATKSKPKKVFSKTPVAKTVVKKSPTKVSKPVTEKKTVTK